MLGDDLLRLSIKYARNMIIKKSKIDRNCNKNKHKNIKVRKFTEDEI